MLRKVTKLILFAVIAMPVLSVAQTAIPSISPAMMEQFRQLPRAEQERLARQYGVDLSTLQQGGLGNASGSISGSQDITSLTQTRRERERLQQLQEDPRKQKAGLERFGLKLFDAEISTFAPVLTQPVPDNYILGADDQLLLQLFGKQSSQSTLTVSRDGTVNLPDIGPVTVGGLSYNVAIKLITERVRQTMIGVDAAVSMGQLRTINIFVAGEAKYPGAYAVSALTSVTQALFVAGGVSDIGSLREITVKRAGKTIAEFDLYDLLLRGDLRQDINLQHGDVVFIAPVKALAEVHGEVKRPAIYEVKPNDTLADLLSMAGGAKAGAYPRAAVLERFNQYNLRDLQNLDLTDTNTRNIKARAGDVLRIAGSSGRVENQLTLAGAVVRPGFYAWRQGMTVNNLIGSLWSDLLMTADLDYALIAREINAAGDLEFIHFNLGQAVTQPDSIDNIALHPRDKILIFHHADQYYQRNKLNDFIRKQLTDVLDENTDRRWLLGDLASDTFKKLDEEPNVFQMLDNVEQPISEGETPLTVAEQEKLLKSRLNYILEELFTDLEVLQLTPHLNRTELLYPLLKRAKQQARTNQELKLVSISGDVKVPGEYPLTAQATVSSLLLAAGGLKDSAFVGRAELSRVHGENSDFNGINVSHQAVNLQAILTGSADPVTLQSRDRLNIFSTPEWKANRTIELSGEVRFPGKYSIQHGEKLSDVLQRAGGFTDNAFVSAAVFTREQVKEKEAAQFSKLIEQLKTDIATRALSTDRVSSTRETLLMIAEIEKIRPVGRLVVNIEQILAQNPSYDVVVEDGDYLHIPRVNRSVTVVGEVQHTGSHRFDSKLSFEEYLNLAGGFRKRADDSRVYVIRADGSVMIPKSNRWFSVDKNTIQPGDTIVVPLDTEYKDNMTLWAQVTQIFYQSAVAIAALNSF
ncbi:SLBB domain-containing protein [Chromatiaceae bacterium AAb-1]|nr:SLBB domain-containing protein [Chromatiaceae bacterium AAb-1]